LLSGKLLTFDKFFEMEELRFAATKNTPEVILNPEGKIRIRGRSIHENAVDFFAPVEEWISAYIISPANVTSVEIALDYFNSASAKVFIAILQKITYVTLKHKKFVINWYYEDGDEDILERGEYFASILDVPVNFIKIK
jgi:SiaC family regulatory phosphoprotein